MLCKDDYNLTDLNEIIYLDNAGKTPLPFKVAAAGRDAIEHRVCTCKIIKLLYLAIFMLVLLYQACISMRL